MMDFFYTIRQSVRARHLRVTINCDASVIVTTPLHFSANKVGHFLYEKKDWIMRKVEYFKKRKEAQVQLPRGERAFYESKNQAQQFVYNKIVKINDHYNFSFNRIAIKNHSSRWGSCSKQKNLNFNYRILFLPKELAEYVIVHELCHLGEFNHSKKFWALVHQVLPNGKILAKTLKNFSF